MWVCGGGGCRERWFLPGLSRGSPLSSGIVLYHPLWCRRRAFFAFAFSLFIVYLSVWSKILVSAFWLKAMKNVLSDDNIWFLPLHLVNLFGIT